MRDSVKCDGPGRQGEMSRGFENDLTYQKARIYINFEGENKGKIV
jgi:hypothetical protein